MKTLGTLDIKDQSDIVVLRNKTRLVAKALMFTDMEATKMAALISEISRSIREKTASFQISFHIMKPNGLLFDLESKEAVHLTHKNPFEAFFDNFKTEASQNNGHKISLSKSFPKSLQKDLDEGRIQEARTILLHLSEKELLRELERKNKELAKAYEALQKSQKELLDRTQQLAKVGGWEISLEDMSLIWTDEVYRIHELPPDKKPKVEEGINFYAPEVRPKITEAVENGIENGVPWDLELPFITAKGKRKWVRAIGYPKMENGVTVRLSGVIQDITKQKEAGLLIEKKNKELELKNKELEQFVYIASHDLQEPLRTVSSFTELISANYSKHFDETGLTSMRYINEATNRMRMFIKGLLDYSRIGRNDEQLKIDCNELVNSVLEDLDTIISETDAIIEVAKLPEVQAFSIGLRQLFQNLIANAIKFRKKNKSPVVRISATEEGEFWKFSVKDNGIGIIKEHQDRIFTIFQRLHTRNEYEGTGIGLANCRKIANLHGGRIWVTSAPNKGSTFYFTIKK